MTIQYLQTEKKVGTITANAAFAASGTSGQLWIVAATANGTGDFDDIANTEWTTRGSIYWGRWT